MGILRRVRDITVASFNEQLEKAEDPVKLIDRYLRETKDDIIQAEQLYQQCKVHQNQLKRQYTEASQQADNSEQQAVMALKAGEDQLARSALHAKNVHQERANQFRELADQSKQTTQELEVRLKELSIAHSYAADKRQYYAARMESARLQSRVNERRHGWLDNSVPHRLVHRLDQHLGELELEARSLRDVRRGVPSGRPVEAKEYYSSSIEYELQQLKNELLRKGS